MRTQIKAAVHCCQVPWVTRLQGPLSRLRSLRVLGSRKTESHARGVSRTTKSLEPGMSQGVGDSFSCRRLFGLDLNLGPSHVCCRGPPVLSWGKHAGYLASAMPLQL